MIIHELSARPLDGASTLYLVRHACDPDFARAHGLVTAIPADSPVLGFPLENPALAIPSQITIPQPSVLWQVRHLKAGKKEKIPGQKRRERKESKFEQASKTASPPFLGCFNGPGMAVVAEGAIKALALKQHLPEFAPIGLRGVDTCLFNPFNGDERPKNVLVAEDYRHTLNRHWPDLNRREVVVFFDRDVDRKPRVLSALIRLCFALRTAGAIPRYTWVPSALGVEDINDVLGLPNGATLLRDLVNGSRYWDPLWRAQQVKSTLEARNLLREPVFQASTQYLPEVQDGRIRLTLARTGIPMVEIHRTLRRAAGREYIRIAAKHLLGLAPAISCEQAGRAMRTWGISVPHREFRPVFQEEKKRLLIPRTRRVEKDINDEELRKILRNELRQQAGSTSVRSCKRAIDALGRHVARDRLRVTLKEVREQEKARAAS